jgi:predicted glycoside hydrolase/deacetylase ChbG (UPF0249 family)
MTVTGELILCADDFGLSAAVDAAVVSLAEAGRLSGTGCMVAGPTLAGDAAELTAVADRIDIGLHFFLTEYPTLGPVSSLGDGVPSLGSLLRRGLTGRLDRGEIAAEFGRQIDRFREVFGRDPDYVDGHQHVHLLPAARAAIWSAFDEGRLDARRTWLRDCHEPFTAVVGRGVAVSKTLIISALGLGFAAAAGRRGVAVNDGFRGITEFGEATPYGDRFVRFLAGRGRRPLVMCHPARPDRPHDPDDPIARSRFGEWAYFSSDRFVADLAAAGIGLVRSPRRG